MIKFKTIQTKIISLSIATIVLFFGINFLLQLNEIEEYAFEMIESTNNIVNDLLVEHISAYVYNHDEVNIQLSIDSINSDYIKSIYILDKDGIIIAKNKSPNIVQEIHPMFETLLKKEHNSIRNTEQYIVMDIFSVLDVPIGYMVVEANLETYNNYIKRELFEFIIEGLLLISVFFIISYFVAKSIVSPIYDIVYKLSNTKDDDILMFPKQEQKEFQYLGVNIANKHNKLLESKSNLNTIFDMTTDGIAIIDKNTNFLFVNRAFGEITGYTKDSLLERSFIEFIPLDFKDEIIDIIRDVFYKGSHSSFENSCSVNHDKIIDAIISMNLMPDRKIIMLVLKDVTKENQYKKEKLEQERKFIEQTRMAQMGEMISMIAHQWRQPLSSISATSMNMMIKIQLGEYDLETKEGRDKCENSFIKQLNNIEHYTQSLTTTINDFRNFYKPNKLQVLSTLEDVVAKSLKIIEGSLTNDNIDIVYDYNFKEKIALYDSELMQVVLNILKNAQDNFKEKGIEKPLIKITTKDSSLIICDNGGGIPERIMKNIFDPYFSTKDEKNGTGLGLYMSKIIVNDHHKGALHVDNQEAIEGEGIGACFTIKLNLSSQSLEG
ncbi:PAS domain S-box protein [Candidatus Sulfurimonas marisnigri]|uniref:histidine kinase n=1 Tax=Candidatus Sulfurimonas marisnigri TaxID=2740405 RepID=A0A7S7M267_9BACT|nr:ATP-binding protein [Candidatus Sulfurimonas marisnigri]QOY55741.1 PAS domain S-box protein [Candidatus Sulfurimonas marisnigri]